MKILVACEFSGLVRDAFIAKGYDAISCDLLPTERPGPHYQGDIRDILGDDWDMMIAFPPCTHLASSGARYFAAKRVDGRQQAGVNFFLMLTRTDIPKVVIENPVGIMSNIYRKPDQIIQPFQFGHPESKATCLWLKGLPKLKAANILEPQWKKNPDGTDYKDSGGKRYNQAHNTPLIRWENQTASGQNKLPPSKDRWKLRSITYQGIADAMAEQWG